MMGLNDYSRSQPVFLTERRRRWLPWGAAAATGSMLVLAFPKFAWSLLAWFALAPLLWAVARGAGGRAVRPRQAFALGWAAGLIYAFFSMNWIAHSMARYGGFALWLAYGVALVFACVLALFPALFAAAVNSLARTWGARAIALAPTLWVASEWLREVVTGVTWNQLGVSQARHLFVVSLAGYGGVALVSWVVATGSAAVLVITLAGARAVRLAAAALLIGAGLIYLLHSTSGPLTLTPGSLDKLKYPVVSVAGVQPNIPLDLASTPEESAARTEQGVGRNIALTREAISRSHTKSADLVVWAESPLSLSYEQDAGVRAKLDALARETRSFVIFNVVGRDGEGYFNSAQTIGPEPSTGTARLKRYDKMRLVPFGEYVPLRPLLGRFVPAIVGDFTPGQEAVVNLLKLNTDLAIVAQDDGSDGPAIERTTRFVRVGTFICYEAAYPNVVRRFVNSGATLLINISDDAWFGATAGPLQHLDHVRMRAIENNRDLVRVTNSGVSALITARGEVVDALPQFTAASHVWRPVVRSEKTFYTRHGDWFAMLCVAVSAVALAAAAALKFRRKEAPRS
jgi:apolipoprotein N-acyltransferase